MSNIYESANEIKAYANKLLKIIQRETTFSFMNLRLVNKNRVDDILCCIDASFPEEYKIYTQKGKNKRLDTRLHYYQVLQAIKNKFVLSPSSYKVYYKEAVTAISKFITAIDKDFVKIAEEMGDIF